MARKKVNSTHSMGASAKHGHLGSGRIHKAGAIETNAVLKSKMHSKIHAVEPARKKK